MENDTLEGLRLRCRSRGGVKADSPDTCDKVGGDCGTADLPLDA